MPRLPFKDETPEDQAPARKPRGRAMTPLTVSQVAALVKDALAASIPDRILVRGEVSNFTSRTHWFFSLKDENATIRCVCFASAARKVEFPVKDGLEVVATGRLDFFEGQGSLQLYVDKLEPVGVGELELRFRALCEELKKLGYFDAERKKPLPLFPQRVAVVTSRSGAALQDVIKTAGKRWGGCRLYLVDVLVQGPAAAPQIAQAINGLSRFGPKLGIDAIILTRGGGSIEDLWAFNERVVADAIYRCALPIIAAIGHETDVTVAELVADLRCSTPTQAAMQVVPDRAALEQQIDALSRRLAVVITREVKSLRQRLDGVARHPFFRRPQAALTPLRDRLDRLGAAIRTGIPRLLKAKADRLEALSRQLASVGPMNVLKRGYSYTLDDDGKVVRSVGQVSEGERITTVVSDGRFGSVVSPIVGAKAAVARPAPRRKPKDAGEPSLFGEAE